jgi:hypothetical protein
VYGTQLLVDETGTAPWPLHEPEGVDRLRASVGLGPLADYIREASAPPS